jgi:tetratricopeptide (TPR) repeat protein
MTVRDPANAREGQPAWSRLLNFLASADAGRRAFLLLFVAAFGLRLLYGWEQSLRNPLFGFPVVDARMYDDWADEMAGGKWLWTELRNYHPAYPLFLAVCKLFFFGQSPWGVRVVQSLLGAGAAVMLAAAAGRILGRRAGLFAGWGAACAWMWVLYDGERYAESLCLFALAACLYQLFCRPPGWSRALLAGCSCALAVACRPNLALMVPAVAAALVVWPHAPRRRAGWHLAVFGALLLLFFLPVLLRNRQLGEGWVLRSQQSWNVYAALEPAFGGLHPAAGIAFDRQMRRAFTAGCGGSHAQIEAYWLARARELLREQPGAVAWNFFVVRGLIFLDAIEWGQELDVYAYRGCSRLLSLPWPGFGWIFPLACAGLLGVWREQMRGGDRAGLTGAGLLLLLLLSVVVATFPFKVTGRYRLPVMLLLLPFAGAALDRVVRLLRERRFRAAAAAGGVFLAAGAVCWPDWADLRHRQPVMHDFYIGLKYRKAGEPEKAEKSLRAETARYPRYADPPQALAELLLAQGRQEEALAAVCEALRREPEFWKAWNTRARLALALGRPDEALMCADRSLALFAGQPEPWLVRRLVYAQTGAWEAENDAFQEAIRTGASPALALEYGLRLEERGLLQEALRQYGAVIEDAAAPAVVRARASLLAGYLVARRLDDPGRAAALWRRVVTEFAEGGFDVDQARYLTGLMTEAQFRQCAAADGTSAADLYGRYARSLRHRWQNDPAGAEELLRGLAREKAEGLAGEPVKWAAEDLARTAPAAHQVEEGRNGP